MEQNYTEKLTICFDLSLIFRESDDYDGLIKQMVDRGFNCVRLEDGAGVLWDSDGNVRTDVLVKSIFGKYQKYTGYDVFARDKRICPLERLLKVVSSAKKYGMKVILSSWFYLHTNWWLEEEITKPLFELSTKEKMSFFANELIKIIDVLKKENLFDTVAFVEIFNEFDGLPFVRASLSSPITTETALEMRALHEEEISKIKRAHADVLVAYDSISFGTKAEIIPRNIDVLNVHNYYAWPVYEVIERDIVRPDLDEPNIPDDVRYFLKEKLVTVKEILECLGGEIKTGRDWPRRISLYASIDENKLDELSKLLDESLKNRLEEFRANFKRQTEYIVKTVKEVVPNAKLVMGEGVTYCTLPKLTFERDSETFWQLIKEQVLLFNEKGFYGTLLATTHSPDAIVAWDSCTEKYKELNELFLNG